MYILEVYALMAAFVFGLAGIVVLVLTAWNRAKDYARARQAMRRIRLSAFREPVANSRTKSRTHDPDFSRVA
jgi:hypothetical protein